MRFVFAFMLMVPLAAFSQSKGDSRIVVIPSDTTKLFDKLITLLYTEGYTVKVEDKARRIIVTDDKTLTTYLNPKVRLTLFIDTAITITGQLNSNLNIKAGNTEVQSPSEPITNKGAKGSIYKSTWNEMQRFTKLIGSKITYTK